MPSLFGNSQTSPEVIQIPKNIQNDITERGFHLYKWISPDEVQLSIERDFLKTLRIIGIPLAIISILVAIFSGGSITYFFVVLFIGITIMFAYLLVLSLQRSFLLSRGAFVILTDSSISLGGKIHSLSEFSTKNPELEQMEDTFEEELFGESQLSESKNTLTKDVLDQLFGGYRMILEGGDNLRLGNSRDSAQGILVILAFYTLYVIVMSVVYFIGVLFLLVFGSLIVWTNRKYLQVRGNTVMKINTLFGDLSEDSDEISDISHNLKKLLQQAQENDWKDGLLLRIQKELSRLSEVASQAVDDVKNLQKTIENSAYKDMFASQTYHKWIKKQITNPLHEITKLLENTLQNIQASKKNIEDQIANKPSGKNFLENLELQLQRLNMQEKEISEFLPLFEKLQESLQ